MKYRKKARKGKKKRGRPASGASVAGVSVDSLVAAKQLIDQAGSAEAAVQAIGVLRRLQG